MIVYSGVMFIVVGRFTVIHTHKLQEVEDQKVMIWLGRVSLTPPFPLEIQWEISTCRCTLPRHHHQDTRHPQVS